MGYLTLPVYNPLIVAVCLSHCPLLVMPTAHYRLPLQPALLLCSALLLGVLAGCGSSRNAQPTETAADSSATVQGSAFTLLFVTESGNLVTHNTQSGSTTPLVRGVQSVGSQALSPDRSRLAVSYMTDDSTHLALVDRAGPTIQRVHGVAGAATYSLAWHPTDDRLAVAYYTPASDGTRGPGDVLTVRPRSAPQRVGCQAAREVLHWFADGTLATRDDENVYIVAENGCATQASFDARRIHEATYSASGERLAYIYRELNYDRDAGAYRPDSALTLSAPDGQGSEVLFGDERAARHLRWAPEADELAFSARLEDTPRRQIMIYNAVQDRILFLIPPSQAAPGDQTHPRWSPSGNFIAFTQHASETATAVVRVEGQTRQLGSTVGPVAGWIDDQTLVVRNDSRLRVVDLSGNERYARPAPKAFLHGWAAPQPAAAPAGANR